MIYPFSGTLRFSHDELVESDYRHGVGLTSMRQRAEELGGRWLIAERLVISPKTVRKHISSIFSKLQMTSRLEAIMRAKDAGMS